MIGVWTYPQTLLAEGIEKACEDLAARGVTSLSVASHHHSARVLQPRVPDSLFANWRGGCNFEPDPELFAGSPIQPIRNDGTNTDEPLTRIVDAAADCGIEANAWTVYFHSTRLTAENPAYRMEDAFGTVHEHALCPSNPAVRQYFATVTQAVTERGVDAVELEAVRYPSAFHGHGDDYGHDARQVLPTETETRLLSQCFCDACREKAQDHPVDFDRARSAVREFIRNSFENPAREPMSLSDVLVETPVLRELFEFRASRIDRFFERLSAVTGDVTVVGYVREADPDWSAGRTISSMARHCDRLRLFCYVSDPTVARERIRTLQRQVSVPVDAGVSLDPSLIRSGDEFAELMRAINGEVDGTVTVFNHAMMTDRQLEWLEPWA